MQLLFEQVASAGSTLLMVSHDASLARGIRSRSFHVGDCRNQTNGAGVILLRVAMRSLLSRRITVALTVFTIALEHCLAVRGRKDAGRCPDQFRRHNI